MDDDDAFLYGEPKAEAQTAVLISSALQPVSFEAVKSVSNGLIEHLEAKAEEEEPPFGMGADEFEVGEENAGGEEEETADEEEEEDEDDIEIIMDQPSRSIDNRPSVPSRPPLNRPIGPQSTPIRPPHAQSQLTTEYTPRDRNAPSSKAPILPTGDTPKIPSVPIESTSASAAPEQSKLNEGLDPSTLPPATAPPSHPSINPDMTGFLDGQSIFDVDISTMAEKPWRLPGSDISDWFNYGFDEISWEAYCYRRRDLGDLANVLKTNVLNFAAMPEDQLIALPPELRTMVVTGANAMMNTAASQGMMGPSVGMNPMMEMPGMGPMSMGPMGMGMNGDMMQPGGPLMQDGPVPGQGPVGQNGTPEQGVQMGMQDGFGPGMMGMGGDFGMQEQGAMGQPMYPTMEGSATPVSVPVQTPVPTPAPVAPAHMGRGAPPAQFRGRAMAQGLRGRGGFVGRGRGYGGAPVGPVRPASPLPPGVPTGPRNQNRYKDRDNNAPAVEGLDYGGTAKDGGGRTPSGEPEDRLSRKRRISPGLDDIRGSKRR